VHELLVRELIETIASKLSAYAGVLYRLFLPEVGAGESAADKQHA
jgi:hypothetical protein